MRQDSKMEIAPASAASTSTIRIALSAAWVHDALNIARAFTRLGAPSDIAAINSVIASIRKARAA